jgi:hypothetical protein
MIITINKWLSRPLKYIEYDIDKNFEELVVLYSKDSKVILELGGVSRPVLKKSNAYTYIGIDIDEDFNHNRYYDEFYCQSVENSLPVKGDLIFSKYLLEHVKNVKKSYEMQISALNASGKIIHLYPLGYHPFSLLNKLLGNNLTRKLIPIVRRESKDITGYPAFYSLGNSRALEKFLRSKKDIKVEFKYHYGAVDYFSFFFPFAILISLFNAIARGLRLKFFASNVLVIISKES